VNSFICKWKTAFRAARTHYDWDMLKAPTDADLIRLRQFLRRLETDVQGALDDPEAYRYEIERLKDEIAYLEAARSKAFLAEIGIDFGGSTNGALNRSAAAGRTIDQRGRPS
jgi:hypothetical protein